MHIKVALNHVTHYSYDRLVKLSPQVVRLRPAQRNGSFPFTLDLRRS